jgi:hypothetical protein
VSLNKIKTDGNNCHVVGEISKRQTDTDGRNELIYRIFYQTLVQNESKGNRR